MRNYPKGFRSVLVCAVVVLLCNTMAVAQFWASSPKNLSNNPPNQSSSNPYVAWGNGFAVLWHNGDDMIRFSRVDENGSLVQTPVIINTSPGELDNVYLQTTFTGANFVTMFTRKNGKNTQLCSVCIKPDGTINGSVHVVDETHNFYRGMYPVWNGSYTGCFFIRVNDTGNVLYFIPLDANGVETGPEEVLFDNVKVMTDLDATWTGKYFAAVMRHKNNRIVFVRVTADGKLKGKAVTLTPYAKARTAAWMNIVPYTKHRYGLSWIMSGKGFRDVCFARLKQTGKFKGPIKVLAKSTNTITPGYPCISYNKDNGVFAIFWKQGRGDTSIDSATIYGAKVSNAGKVITPSTKLAGMNSINFAFLDIDNSGDATILAWSVYDGNGIGNIYTMKMISELW